MSDAKHTPGPWEWEAWGDDPDDKSTLAAPPSSRPDGICDMFPDLGQRIFSVEDPIENRGDRALIAAAPDLLAACEAALETFDINDDYCKVCNHYLKDDGHSATCAVPVVVNAITKALRS